MTDFSTPEPRGAVAWLIGWCLRNRLPVILLSLVLVGWGLMVAPFDWDLGGLPRDRVPVDAIPNIGENQQIVFTHWAGRSPRDVEDQVTYPLASSLLGLPGVKSIRSTSNFGFSAIFVIFEDDIKFYWSRSRILEKLASLPDGTLPEGVQPNLGPDATALGQVFWYTLEGRGPDGGVTGGWPLHELRSIQDWQVRYALQGVPGVSEVASVGGFVKEYQVDLDPDALRAYGVSLDRVFSAVRQANREVGARTIEINRVEYVLRGTGFIKNLEDLRQTVVTAREGIPVTLDQLGQVKLGPALRRGVLDKNGVEAVGGVVVTRHGANPLEVIERVKQRIGEIAPALPRKTLEDGTRSQVTIVPYYDRTGLIHETLGTLEHAISLEVIATVIVVLVLMLNLRCSLMISSVLPLAVLFSFIGMKLFGVEANIVALSGIAIAIGTVVDMGIVLIENSQEHLRKAGGGQSRLRVIHRASAEVGGAVLTAVLTTVIGFLPVFTMEGAEGKLFVPLAYTKSFTLVAAIVLSLTLLPVLASLFLKQREAPPRRVRMARAANIALAVLGAVLFAQVWEPAGPGRLLANSFFTVLTGGLVLAVFIALIHFYEPLLRLFLRFKLALLMPVAVLMAAGLYVWSTLGEEFMPSLDEGSFLYMPTTMPHASIGEATEILHMQNRAIRAIPEVGEVVGKIGRVDSALDPAPVSMVETYISYKDEYGRNAQGEPVRQWRDEIQSPDDIWQEIVRAARVPGVTSAPKLQPIETRLVMLQTGMRANLGIKVFGPDLETIESSAMRLEALLRQAPGVDAATVFAERVVGKPYLEIRPDRRRLARYGISVGSFNEVIETAVGGKTLTTTVEGRERYPVRVRYMRELRDSPEALKSLLIPTPEGRHVPLSLLADIAYVRGPQAIKSEDNFLVGYVIFDKLPGWAEVDVVEAAQEFLEEHKAAGELGLPAGISYRFTGSYEHQVRAEKRLAVVLPLALLLIFLLVYFQFKQLSTAFIVFGGVFLAWSGGFILIGLYGQPWFLDVSIFGTNLRELFQISTINLSVAVWVGFLALFGIATDDGVIMGTYLKQRFDQRRPDTPEAIREETVQAALRRIRPAAMTSATTILALLPVLTSTGRGADVMIPMAIPTFGGMLLAVLTVFLTPVLFCWWRERLARHTARA